jgi:hypothetical protein
MISLDWMNIGMDALSLIVSFIIVSILASFFLWLIDKAIPEVDFLIIRNDSKAKSIASLGWLILYALVFAGAINAPYSLDLVIIRQVIWTFVMLLTASVLTIIVVKFISPYMSYCGKEGFQSLRNDSLSTSIFYLGLCVLIGVVSYSASTA